MVQLTLEGVDRSEAIEQAVEHWALRVDRAVGVAELEIAIRVVPRFWGRKRIHVELAIGEAAVAYRHRDDDVLAAISGAFREIYRQLAPPAQRMRRVTTSHRA